jgi:hypothetical protein
MLVATVAAVAIVMPFLHAMTEALLCEALVCVYCTGTTLEDQCCTRTLNTGGSVWRKMV